MFDLTISKPIDIRKSYIPQKKALLLIVIGKKINYSALGSQIFADLQPHFPRFVSSILHTNLGKWSFP